ncbi:efflux RND transporter periplasmic adaptor subunit [Candidatus Formimonas warabiya]|uniref:Uncharacterized protein n=1 Tax=Formimonas warabiya TaxID=1761012 RepID=A0A3G1KUT5_FORW1|nr:efflux RND transporter periplasmic adaptor subunit [Candidatus Formimonas warabiya]ATW25955.1 hypothetical protein DCMF_15275 [Candidatus Formimonas warabiya]
MVIRKKQLVILLILITSLSVFAGCGQKETPADQPQEEQAVLVEAGKVVTGDISNTSTVNGKIAPNKEVSIIPKTPGKVAEVNFQVGDRVHQGDILIRLDSTELQAQLKQAKAGLALAKANYQNALTNLERVKSLYEQGAVSKQQLDDAQTQAAVGSTDSASASVQLIEAQLANTVIKSPVDGIVSARNIEVGEIAGQSAVMTIVDIEKVKVETNVTEAEVNKLSLGQKLDVRVSAVGDQPFSGTIRTISPAADSQVSTFPISVEILNPQHQLKPGMFAEIKLALETKKGVPVIPKQAVIDSGDMKYVFVIKDKKAIQTEIKTGVEDDTRVEVVSGLTAGDAIVLTGQNKLQNETPVTLSGGM